MARELSQEAVLDFLWAAGGRAPNTALLRHFQRFLRDPALTEQQRRERREYFKSLVNSLATVHPAASPGASKDIVLRRRYRDLLDEELPPPEEQREQEEKKKEPEPPPPPRRDPEGRRGRPRPDQPLSSGPWGLAPRTAPPRPPLSPAGLPRSPSPPLPAAGLPSARPPSPSRTPPPPWGRGMPPPYRLPQPRSPPQSLTGMSLLKAPLALSPRDLAPSRSLPLLPHTDLPPSRSLPLLSAPEVLPPSRSLQTLPASSSSSPLLSSGPEVLPATRLPPSQYRSLQQLPTRPSPDLPRGSRGLTPKGPNQPQVPRLYARQSLTLPSAAGMLPPTRPSPCQSLPQSPTLQPPAPMPVFQSIRRQLALSEGQGTPPSVHDDCRRQPRSVLSKSSPRNAASRGPLVPLGQREHAWLVAMSAGCWAQVRGLFLEEPELALQKDFISGFTVLHWLAKHGDGPGLQELAAAARQLGLALDVDVRSGCGYTPLHLAAIHGHQLVIKVLVLQLGCQVQVRDGSGRRPWEYLGSSTSGEIWQLLEAPRGTIMFPTQPLARSVSSVSKVSLSTGRALLSSHHRIRKWYLKHCGRNSVLGRKGVVL
uniref:Sosondowah ankyrin repeat domain family member B n=1 Tax=Malurus cyaneus samueli TaxID=2593467 RepID=A0A8C5X6E4_9PASS